ncbi:MAG: putative DNA-binding domain-containing protein [Myxococcales bacterium]|nr:putative DNA-binding domain-containing protein [Myxococcales bacterium]
MPASLLEQQRAFQALVTSGGGDPRGLIAAGELGIYAFAYGARLRDALRADHPKLEASLGPARFDEEVDGYVAARPPSTWTLRDLGVALGAYLDGAADVPPWAGDLARLERARVEVFDGADATPLGRDDVAALPPDALAALALAWVPASAVVTLAWTVDDGWAALERDAPWIEPAATARTVLVWRRGLEVVHRTLEPDEAVVAPVLAAAARFADVCAALAPLTDEPADRAIALLIRWLDAGALTGPEAAP